MIERARTREQLEQVKALLLAYADWLDAHDPKGADRCFQGLDREVEALPGSYAPPDGTLLLATQAGRAIGCIALRKLDAGVCEMKRLYVRPDFRGGGVGQRLVDALLEEAKRLGYGRMRLDTLPYMGAAVALYRAYGFRDIPPYNDSPVEDTLFLELDLSHARRAG